MYEVYKMYKVCKVCRVYKVLLPPPPKPPIQLQLALSGMKTYVLENGLVFSCILKYYYMKKVSKVQHLVDIWKVQKKVEHNVGIHPQ